MNEEKSKLIIPTEIAFPEPDVKEVELPEAKELVKININELKTNSVIVIKINADGIAQRVAATQQIAMALRPVAPKIKEKGVVLIVMANDESMEVLDEEQMNAMGWFKKEQSSIINPFTNKPV